MQPILVRSLAEYEYLKEHLVAEYQEIDEVTLRDTMEGISSLPEAIAAVIRTYLDDLVLAAALCRSGYRGSMRGRKRSGW